MAALSAIRLRKWGESLRVDHRTLTKRSVVTLLALGALLASAALLGLAWSAGWSSVRSVFATADWLWIIGAPIGILVSHLGYTVAYQQVTRATKGKQLAGEEAVAIVATGFGPFSPLGGFALDATGFRNLGLTKRQATIRVRTLALFEYAVLAPAAFAAALYLVLAGAKTKAGLLPSWVVGVPVGTAAALGLLAWHHLDGGARRWAGPLRHLLEAIEETLSLLGRWPDGLLATAGMALYWAGDIGALAACAAAFSHRLGAGPALIVAYATGYALTRRTLPLAGTGIVEALLPLALSWAGYPLAEAVLTVFVYRLFNVWAVVIPGILGLRTLRSNRSVRG